MERVQTKMRNGEGGFTLVELAIVMIIIGLLITGILKGQEMIANAQVTSTVSGLKGVDAAISTFRDTYNAWPGDITNVASRLPAICTGTCAVNGNGDGRISNGATAMAPGAAIAGEAQTIWMHLAAVELIGGVNATPQTTAINAGDEILATEINETSVRIGFLASGATPTSNLGGAANTYRQGHYLSVQGDVVGTAAGAVGGDGLTPIQAQRLDTKLDDGNPVGGSVRAGGQATCVAGTPTVYNGAVSSTLCTVYYRIQS